MLPKNVLHRVMRSLSLAEAIANHRPIPQEIEFAYGLLWQESSLFQHLVSVATGSLCQSLLSRQKELDERFSEFTKLYNLNPQDRALFEMAIAILQGGSRFARIGG